jgi:hypothetical protein
MEPNALSLESQAKPVSVVQHVRSQGILIDESTMSILRGIDDKFPEELKHFLIKRDGAVVICESLKRGIVPGEMTDEKIQDIWHLSGLYFSVLNRHHEALSVFSAFYDQMLQYQLITAVRMHKGTPLVRMSECHERLGHTVLSKRYLMLTACEDAIRDKGNIDTETAGLYFRIIWSRGMTHWALLEYASRMYELSLSHPQEALFPEWILQELNDEWMEEYPAPQEASAYVITRPYVRHLLAGLGSGSGQNLERLAAYLLACMPGCRARRRKQTYSTDYDVVCAVEGANIDFRSELGRFFICECKDWNSKADFTAMAKFCRVLDSAKCSFGILFSKEGISGEGRSTNAEREQIKVFQQRGMVVIVVSEGDLKKVADGANFFTLLRSKYEQIRLDLR